MFCPGDIGQPNPNSDRRDGVGQDHADNAVRVRVRRGDARARGVHAAAPRGRHVRRQARGRGVRLPARPGGRLHHTLRGLHRP